MKAVFDVDDDKFIVEADVNAGRKARLSGPFDRSYPADDDEIELREPVTKVPGNGGQSTTISLAEFTTIWATHRDWDSPEDAHEDITSHIWEEWCEKQDNAKYDRYD